MSLPHPNGCASSRQPPDLDAERARVKKLASYFGSLGIVPEGSSGSHATDPVISSPALATDATLTALAQLGPLRLQCDRAFVSLTDRKKQYVVAESLPSLSYFDLRSQDRLYLGVVALDVAWSPDTIHIFTDPQGHSDVCTPNLQADRDKFCICDFRADPNYVDRPFVVSWPHARAYLEVPLRTSTGEVIGSYCVVDNRPRHDWADGSVVKIMTDIAHTIMDHIELVKIQEQHNRLERLVNNLCVYVEENTSMQAFETNLHADQHSSDGTDGDSPGASPGASPTPGPKISLRGDSVSNSNESLETQITTPSPTPRRDPFETPDCSPTRPPHTSDRKPSLPTQRPPPTEGSRDIPGTFSRAANLIHEATDIEGIVFLDASPNGFATRLDAKRGKKSNIVPSTPLHVSATTESPKLKMCETLGLSVSGDSNRSAGSLSIPEPLLQRLLQAHPHGTSFFADELDELEEQEGSDAKHLFHVYSSARSILFMPLWDYQKEGWYAAAIGWSTKANRIFASEDLVYISAFGNSIMNEVSRVEAMSVSHAKSNFISSISHELRSPLHGILASTELLKQTELDPERMALAEMVEVCGITLLETMDHLLDFAKINHLYRKGRRASSDSAGSSRGGSKTRKDHLNLCKTADLGLLVQEVVEGAYLGHSAQTGAQFENGVNPLHGGRSPMSKSGNARLHGTKPVLLAMSIEKRDDWRLHTEPGAWRRIVLNLVGNALKYTDRGSIGVSLSCVDAENGPTTSLSEDGGSEKRFICLSVKDTGRGISEEYLKYRLFTPYAQEDPLVNGTGLGLSIVHHLVTHLGGKVNIHSEVGAGTHVRVMIPVPVDLGSTTPNVERGPDLFEEVAQELRGKTILALTGKGSHEPDTDGTILLSNALDTAQSWWGMDIVSLSGSNGAQTPIDFCMLHVSQLGAAHDNAVLKDVPAVIIVVCTRPPTQQQCHLAGLYNATILQQPFGPKKLKNSLNAALSRHQHNNLSPDHPESQQSSNGSQYHRLPHREREPGSSALALGAPIIVTSPPPLMRSSNFPFSPPRYTSLSPSPSFATSRSTPASSPPPEQSSSRIPTTVVTPPSRPAAAASSSPPTSGDDNDRTALKPPQSHLLLVDDNDINLKILTTYARRLNCTFATATNGLEAVEAFKLAAGSRDPPFDIVLMDVSMPVMNGFEATRAIRAWEREQRRGFGIGGGGAGGGGGASGGKASGGICGGSSGGNGKERERGRQRERGRERRGCRILALTGLGSAESQREAFSSGMDEFLIKPVPLKRLRGVLFGDDGGGGGGGGRGSSGDESKSMDGRGMSSGLSSDGSAK